MAETLNKITEPRFNVTQRSVRERFALLEKRFADKTKFENAASGINTEETPLDNLLQEIIEKARDYEAIFLDQTNDKDRKLQEEKAVQEDMRLKAMEALSETQNRKTDDEGSSRKRKRNNGSETINYLREKASNDYEAKLEEIELRKKDQEHNHQMQQMQMQMQQQQTAVLMALVKKLSEK